LERERERKKHAVPRCSVNNSGETDADEG